ncbi:single-pass membrane and coiled-coil domain-containing protein 4 isoform X1 [Cricetulus griseus]|uniref:Single-pass membrane and coiled-coil domain-containing protein 4 n=1 Tax=Cricetulus griseus TaxID=10029 RepID=A0A9J7FVK8_CRIGR|nr:single-pass membrane and coiled-coil domain-containing protein 4 isoform X1 [Cricetulus griseus]XP_027266669.1 single-pass membrane and coiled-coil domain-containing protein 4 isoform X1 [Cricetulus griseus]
MIAEESQEQTQRCAGSASRRCSNLDCLSGLGQLTVRSSPGSWRRITQITLTGSRLTDITEFEVKRPPAWTEDCGPSSKTSLGTSSHHHLAKMRQLKGKPKKETSKDKKERKQAMQEARQQITTVVLPTLAVVVLLIVVFVYVATRPTVTE